jgi:hypothetical protein
MFISDRIILVLCFAPRFKRFRGLMVRGLTALHCMLIYVLTKATCNDIMMNKIMLSVTLYLPLDHQMGYQDCPLYANYPENT